MDYMAEETRRQQLALMRLLLGRPDAGRTEDEAAQSASLSEAADRRGRAAFPETAGGRPQGGETLFRSRAAAPEPDPDPDTDDGTARSSGVSGRTEAARDTPAEAGYGEEAFRRARETREVWEIWEAQTAAVPPRPEEGLAPEEPLPAAASRYGGGVRAGDAGSTVRYTVTEILSPSEAGETDPEALSRIYQRDARRYDGGFALY